MNKKILLLTADILLTLLHTAFTNSFKFNVDLKKVSPEMLKKGNNFLTDMHKITSASKC